MLKKLSLFSIVGVLSITTISLLAQPVSSTVEVGQAESTYEYAQLIVQGDVVTDGDQGVRVRWILGGRNLVPQFVTVESLSRLLSRSVGVATFGNLLDNIGKDQWELVDVRQKTNGLEYWTFKRAR